MLQSGLILNLNYILNLFLRLKFPNFSLTKFQPNTVAHFEQIFVHFPLKEGRL